MAWALVAALLSVYRSSKFNCLLRALAPQRLIRRHSMAEHSVEHPSLPGLAVKVVKADPQAPAFPLVEFNGQPYVVASPGETFRVMVERGRNDGLRQLLVGTWKCSWRLAGLDRSFASIVVPWLALCVG